MAWSDDGKFVKIEQRPQDRPSLWHWIRSSINWCPSAISSIYRQKDNLLSKEVRVEFLLTKFCNRTFRSQVYQKHIKFTSIGLQIYLRMNMINDDETQKYQWNSGKRLWLGRDRNMFGVSLDLNLTPLAFFTFFAERQKRKKAARGVRFKPGLVWRLLRVLCFDLTYLCNKDENRWNDEFFVSEDLIHRFPSVDEHTHGLGFDDWVTITCLNYQNFPEILTPKRRTPLLFISQPGSAVLIVTSPGSAFTRRFPLCQLDRVREDRLNDGRHWRYISSPRNSNSMEI